MRPCCIAISFYSCGESPAYWCGASFNSSAFDKKQPWAIRLWNDSAHAETDFRDGRNARTEQNAKRNEFIAHSDGAGKNPQVHLLVKTRLSIWTKTKRGNRRRTNLPSPKLEMPWQRNLFGRYRLTSSLRQRVSWGAWKMNRAWSLWKKALDGSVI